jgi:hypothetical protein
MTTATLQIEATDVTGQKSYRVDNIPDDASVRELVRELQSKMNMPPNDVHGRPLSYHALHESEGRHLNGSEKVAEVLRSGDRVILQPNIDAGGGIRRA